MALVESESVYTRTLPPREEMDIRHGFRRPRSHQQKQIDANLRRHRAAYPPHPGRLDRYHADEPAIAVGRISTGRPSPAGTSQITDGAIRYFARAEDESERAARARAEREAEETDTAAHPARDWLTLPEVAGLTGYGRRILRTSIDRGHLKAEQPNPNGGHYRVPAAALAAYLAAMRVDAARRAEILARARALLRADGGEEGAS